MSGAGEGEQGGGRRLVDWTKFSQMRTELGASFVRILGYFREDGEKAVAKIEEAMHRRDAAGLVLPAHTLKAEARQFGAEPVAALAEEIEQAGRRALESRLFPDDILPQVAQLRPLYGRTLDLLEEETNPLVAAPPALRPRPEQPGFRPALSRLIPFASRRAALRLAGDERSPMRLIVRAARCWQRRAPRRAGGARRMGDERRRAAGDGRASCARRCAAPASGCAGWDRGGADPDADLRAAGADATISGCSGASGGGVVILTDRPIADFAPAGWRVVDTYGSAAARLTIPSVDFEALSPRYVVALARAAGGAATSTASMGHQRDPLRAAGRGGGRRRTRRSR